MHREGVNGKIIEESDEVGRAFHVERMDEGRLPGMAHVCARRRAGGEDHASGGFTVSSKIEETYLHGSFNSVPHGSGLGLTTILVFKTIFMSNLHLAVTLNTNSHLSTELNGT